MTNRQPVTRRSLLETAAAATVLSVAHPGLALAAPEVGSIKITQAVASLAFVQNALAKDLGFFKAEGLDVENVVTRGGGPDVQAVLAGDAAFTVNDGAQVLPALAKGLKLKCLMATLDRNIINVSMRKSTAAKLGVTPESPIAKKLAALKELKIGVTRPGSLTWQLARFNLIKAGLDPDRGATIVGIGGGPAVAAALDKGDVDVIYISVPLGERVVHAGSAITLIDNANGEDPNLPSFMMEGLWATPDFIRKNPNTCGAAVRAMRKASAFVLEKSDDEVTKALTNTFGGLGREVLEIGVKKVRAAVSKNGRFTQANLDDTQGVLRLNKAIDKSFAIGDVFDGSFVG